MINRIWFVIIVTGILSMALQGEGPAEVTTSIATASSEAIKLAISLTGILAFWSGMMNLAQEADLTGRLARWLSPLVHRLFPSVPKDHPAMGAMLLAIGANILGLGNAATPLGIKAMEALQELNRRSEEASTAMCTFLVLCSSGLTVVPTTTIALRAAANSKDPTSIVVPTLLATTCSSLGALIADRLLRSKIDT